MSEQTPLQILSTGNPRCRHAHDAVSALLHATMLTHGFDKSPADQADFINFWNDSPDATSFRYTHHLNTFHYIVKSVFMGDLIVVNAIAEEQENNVVNMTIRVAEYVHAPDNWDNIDWNSLYSNINDFIELVKRELIAGLMNLAPREMPREEPNPLMIGGPRMPRQGLFGPDFAFDDRNPALNPAHGMQVGPNHPIFRGRGRAMPPGHPSGARFDPFGPFGGVGGDPDNDMFQPPGPPGGHGFDYM